MENRNIKSILQDALEEEIPASRIDLWAGVEERLVAGRNPSFPQGEKMNPTRARRLPRVAFIVLIIIALTALAFVTPQGRAFAQRLFLFFSVREENSFPVSTEQVFSAPSTQTPIPTYILPLETVEPATPTPAPQLPDLSCTSPESQSGYFCQIKAAEAQAGFNAREFLYDPKGLKFSKVTFDPETKEIKMEFVVTTGGGYLFLRQGMAEFPLREDEWDKVPADAVERVQVNGNYAEFASGTFVVYPDAMKAVWEPGGQLSLYWQEGRHWFALEKWGDPYPIEWITKDEMIKLAEGLVDDRPMDAVPPLDPEYLRSVEEAEHLADFDVPVPTLLPQNHQLKRVVWADGIVRLLYGPKDSPGNTLVIFIAPAAVHQAGTCSECPPGVDEEVQVGPWQGWYSRGMFDEFLITPISDQPTPTPFWNADLPIWQVSWDTDTLWISITFYGSDGYGGEMNKETLIKIAESMR